MTDRTVHLPDVGARLEGDTLIVKGERRGRVSKDLVRNPSVGWSLTTEFDTVPPAWLSDLTEPCDRMFCNHGWTPAIGDPRRGATIRCSDCIDSARLLTITEPCKWCEARVGHPADVRCTNAVVTVFEGVVASIDGPNDDGEFVATLTPKEGTE